MLSGQGYNLVVLRFPTVPLSLLREHQLGLGLFSRLVPGCLDGSLSHLHRHSPQLTMMFVGDLLDCGTEIREQVETVGNLEGTGSSSRCSFRIRSSSISRYHLHTVMHSEPSGKRVHVPVGQEVHGAMCSISTHIVP